MTEENYDGPTETSEPDMGMDTREVVFNDDAIIRPPSPLTKKVIPAMSSSKTPKSTMFAVPQEVPSKEGVSLIT